MSYSESDGSPQRMNGAASSIRLATARQDDVSATAGRSREAQRLKFVQSDRELARDSYVKVSITLSFGRDLFVSCAEGAAVEPIELRLAATATIDALAKATGRVGFQLVGIKRLRAFDADVILVVLRDTVGEPRRFVGAVAVRTTYIDGCAAAVLNAVNRALSAPTRAVDSEPRTVLDGYEVSPTHTWTAEELAMEPRTHLAEVKAEP